MRPNLTSARKPGKAKAKLQLRLTQNEHFVAPRSDRTERPMAVGGGPEVSPEAVAAMAKRLVERTRKDLEAQMAVTWSWKIEVEVGINDV